MRFLSIQARIACALTSRSRGRLAGGAHAPSARGRLAWFVRHSFHARHAGAHYPLHGRRLRSPLRSRKWGSAVDWSVVLEGSHTTSRRRYAESRAVQRIAVSYVAVAPGEIAVKMLEHSSLPSLVGSSSVVRYEVQGQTLKLTAFPQQMKPRPASTHRMIESTWVRCPQ